MTTAPTQLIDFDYTKYGFRDEEHYTYKSEKGLNEQVVRTLSAMKGEPQWMLKRRLKALDIYFKKPVPLHGMGANEKLAELDDQNIYYYVRPGEKAEKSWDDVAATILTDPDLRGAHLHGAYLGIRAIDKVDLSRARR